MSQLPVAVKSDFPNADMFSTQFRSRLYAADITVTAIKEGIYVTIEGKEVKIADAVKESVTGSILYSPEELKLLKVHRFGRRYTTEIVAVSMGPVSLAYGHRDQAPWLTVLNFCNPRKPGGGFLEGIQGREESIAHLTTIFPTLEKHWDSYYFSYYAKNKDARGGVYTDKLIWSPGVLIIKYGDFLENPAPVNFISGAAINRYALKRAIPDWSEEELTRQIDHWMYNKIANVLALAAHKEQKVLILGSWGCGRYGNKEENIAVLFSRLLRGLFAGVFERVYFAQSTETFKQALQTIPE